VNDAVPLGLGRPTDHQAFAPESYSTRDTLLFDNKTTRTAPVVLPYCSVSSVLVSLIKAEEATTIVDLHRSLFSTETIWSKKVIDM